MHKLIYPLLAIVVAIFFGFQIQESQKFYYAFNEKIPLNEVDNKLVARYSETSSKENATLTLRRNYSDANQKWQDDICTKIDAL